MFLEVVLSSMISNSPIIKPETFKISSFVGYLCSCYAIKFDIFDCTKTYLGTTILYPQIVDGKYTERLKIHNENNKLAEVFWDANLWELGYFSAIAFNFLVVNYLNSIDSTQMLSTVYTCVLNVAEVLAISSWLPYTCYNTDPTIRKSLHFKANILTVTF